MSTAPARGPVRALLSWFERHARGITTANLVGQSILIVSGSLVRLTESGLGCTRAWFCEEGSLVPTDIEPGNLHPYIEFGNRCLAVLLAFVAGSLAIAVWRSRPDVRWLALVPFGGVVVQAVLGAALVDHELPPLLVGLHMFISVALVWASAILALRWRAVAAIGKASLEKAPLLSLLRWTSLALLVAVVVLGTLTTGSGPHSGDPDVNERLGLDPEAVARTHSASVWAFSLVIALIWWRLRRTQGDARSAGARRAVGLLGGAILLQGALGYTAYLTGRPVGWVVLHMAGISLLVAAHASVYYRTRSAR